MSRRFPAPATVVVAFAALVLPTIAAAALPGDGGLYEGRVPLADAAWTRGMPIRQPLLDLQDRIQLKERDVFDLARERVADASRRYGPGPVAIVRLHAAEDGTWSSRWTLDDGDAESQWRLDGAGPSDVLARGVDVPADRIARRYAFAGGDLESLTATVSAVRTMADYARVLGHLRSLPALRALSLAETRGEDLLFRFERQGGLDAFRRMVPPEGVLLGTDQPARFRLAQ